MANLRSLSGKVKKKLGSELDSDRYNFISLDNAEPDFGNPAADNEVLMSKSDGTRFFGQLGNLLSYDSATGTINVDSAEFATQVQINSVDSATITQLVDSNYIQARQSYDADTLDSQDGTYYLDYTNFTNTPNVLDSADVTLIVDSAVQVVADQKLSLSGDTMQGTLDMNFNRIINLGSPVNDGDATSKNYVDAAIEAGIEGVTPDLFPTGDLGSVDSASFIDAFGIQYGADVYDLLTEPVNTLTTVDLGTDSSI